VYLRLRLYLRAMSSSDAPPESEQLPKTLRKELLRPADPGERHPRKGDECTVHFSGHFEVDGDEFDSSRARGEPVTFKLGASHVIKGWDLAVATMRKGEIARFTCPPEYAYGEQGIPKKVPSNATLIFEIELISWRSDADLFGDGEVTRTKLQEGTGFKEPSEGDEVRLSLRTSDTDGQVLDERPKVEYVVGSGAFGGLLSRMIDRALVDMKRGAVVSLKCSSTYAYGDDSHGAVALELSLHEIFETMDVSPGKDKSIMKKQIVQGDGCQNPTDGGQVTLTLTAVADDANVTVSEFAGPMELQFTAGNGEVCDALEYAVVHMLKGECAVIVCSDPSLSASPRLGLEVDTVVEGKVSLTVELLEFKNGKGAWQMSEEEQLEFAALRKDVGSKLFKAQRYGLALERYKKVVEFLGSSARMSDEGRELVKVCELNKAACMLKLADLFGAKVACNVVLSEEPGNEKALFRRASAHFGLHEFADSAHDLQRLLELNPANTEAKRLLPQAIRGAKQQDKKLSCMFARMNKAFNGFAEEEERRVAEAKEAHEASIARKSAQAKMEAKKWRENRGSTISAAEVKEDMMRAQMSMAEMQRQALNMQWGIKPED